MLPPLAIDPGAAANCRGCGYLLQLGCLHPLCPPVSFCVPLRNGRRTYISAISVSPFCAADGNLFHQYVGPAGISKGVIPSFDNIYTDIFLAHRPRATASIVMKGCRCIRPQPCWVNGVTSPHRVLHLRLCYGTASWTCRPVVAALRFKSVHAGYIYQPRSCGYELARIYRSQGWSSYRFQGWRVGFHWCLRRTGLPTGPQKANERSWCACVGLHRDAIRNTVVDGERSAIG